MREEQSGSLEPEMELDELASETAPPERPTGWKRFILPVLAIAVVVLVIVSAIIVRFSSGEKVTGSNAYDLLLDKSDLPTVWTVESVYGVNATYGGSVNGQYGVESYASALWSKGSYDDYHISISCAIFVFDSGAHAHTAMLNWTWYVPTLNGTIGDESYADGSSGVACLDFREANVVVRMFANWSDDSGSQMYHYSVEELLSVAELQCDKIDR
jgi:hypothetical protein